MEEAINYNPNSTIVWNRVNGFLWWKLERDKAEINEDKTHLKYINVDSEIKKTSIYTIIFLKYVSALFFIWFIVYDVNTYYPSMTAAWISILIYFYIKKNRDKLSVVGVFITTFLILVGYLAVLIIAGDNYNIGYILNYIFQYLVGIFLLDTVYQDLYKKGFDGYYTVEKKPFKFIKIYDNDDEIDDSIGFSDKVKMRFELAKKIIVTTVFTIGFAYSSFGILHEVAKNTDKERIESQITIGDTSTPVFQKYLDDKASEIDFPKLHKMNTNNIFFSDIQSYKLTKVTANKESYQLVFTTNPLEKSENWEIAKFPKTQEIKTYMSDYDYYFIVGDITSKNYKIYKILNTK